MSASSGYLYLDFDGFFASVEEHLREDLRGRPIGIYAGMGDHEGGVLISVNQHAKDVGVRSGQRSGAAKAKVPELNLVAQRPDQYIRIHHELIRILDQVLMVDAVHSVDEMSFRIPARTRAIPWMRRLKDTCRDALSDAVTFSIGAAASPWLAKVAAESVKPDGMADWTDPDTVASSLFGRSLSDLPGVGPRIAVRLDEHGIETVRDLYESSLSRTRAAWGSVEGERVWLSMHGHDVQWPEMQRRMFGHGRVFEPSIQSWTRARPVVRWIGLCAWVRSRDEGYRAQQVKVRVIGGEGQVAESSCLLSYRACEADLMRGIVAAWDDVRRSLHGASPRQAWVFLTKLVLETHVDRDLFARRSATDRLDEAIGTVRSKYGTKAICYGRTGDRSGRYSGLKIAFNRVPSLDELDRILGDGKIRWLVDESRLGGRDPRGARIRPSGQTPRHEPRTPSHAPSPGSRTGSGARSRAER